MTHRTFKSAPLSFVLLFTAGCNGVMTDSEIEDELRQKDQAVALRGARRPLPPRPQSKPPAHFLTGWAALEHTARYPGPVTGQFNGTGPYEDQPIPGYSGLLANGDGTFLALPDNGYGSKANSADYVLGYYTVTPKLKRVSDGTTIPGQIVNDSFVPFNDKNGLLKNGSGIDMLITADSANYRSGNGFGTDSGVTVDDTIRSGRLLTGYDFDVESIARDTDGTYWVGEEFGPFILHFDADGTLLDEPFEHPILKSPQHPAALAVPALANHGSSRGYESLTFDHEHRYLYAVPESAPAVDALRPVPGDERVLEIYEFDPDARAYTGVSYRYRKDGEATNNGVVIGDMTNVGADKYVLIERDNFGLDAEIKRLYIVDLNVVDRDGILVKKLLVDLLDISDPLDIGGPLEGLEDKKFDLPFVSVECVLPINPFALGVAIDTNFPATGRDPAIPASTEFITIRFREPVATFAPRR